MGQDAVLQVPPLVRAPADARRFAMVTLLAWGHRRALPLVELVLSELVTNAVVHGAAPIELSLHLDGDRLHVAVTDAAPAAVPQHRQPVPGREGSYGLGLISSVSEDWGYTVGDGCKTVWAELDLAVAASW